MSKRALVYLVIFASLWAADCVAGAEEVKSGAVIKMMHTAQATLQQGLTASESKGKPISGKFEIDEGHFQLSVYTAKDGKFSEVIVDQKTGAVAKTEPMTDAEDLAEAKVQSEAMSKATKTLTSAVDQAEKANPGTRAVSVIPKLVKGRTVAVVTLLKGTAESSVTESLE